MAAGGLDGLPVGEGDAVPLEMVSRVGSAQR
jgi:hypothetical protein